MDEDDIRDAALFRFWIRAAEQFPGETVNAILHCRSADEYRTALKELATKHGVNLPA